MRLSCLFLFVAAAAVHAAPQTAMHTRTLSDGSEVTTILDSNDHIIETVVKPDGTTVTRRIDKNGEVVGRMSSATLSQAQIRRGSEATVTQRVEADGSKVFVERFEDGTVTEIIRRPDVLASLKDSTRMGTS